MAGGDLVPKSGSAPWKDLGEEEKRAAKERYAAMYGTRAGTDEAEAPRKEPPAWNPETARFVDKKPVANVTTRPKEEKVSVNPKEKILAAIQRKGPCVSTPILQCCSVKAEELHRYVKELESKGKIKTWVDGKKTYYTVAGAQDPRGKKAAPPPATPPSKSRAKAKRKAPQSSPGPRELVAGNTKDVLRAALEELEARRAVIDDAITKLKEVVNG